MFSLLLLLKRLRLLELIKEAELELKHARDHARDQGGPGDPPPHMVIVHAHDRLVRYRGDLRRIDEYARSSRVVLVPLLGGGLLAVGYTLGALPDLDPHKQRNEHLTVLEQKLAEWRVNRRAMEEALALQAETNARLATQMEAHAQEKEALRARLTKAEDVLAEEKKERIELDVLVGKAEQRLRDLERAHGPAKDTSETFAAITSAPTASEDAGEPDSTLAVPGEESFDESDVQPDGTSGLPADWTALYTGKLDGQIAFEGAQRTAASEWSRRHVYVLVRWGESSWIVAEGPTTVNAAGAVEGEFKVILPLGTIRTLDVTAIATDKEYRRYQYVRLQDHAWRASTATIPVHRS